MSWLAFILFIPPIVAVWWFGYMMIAMFWWSQKRWVVWYPATKHGPAMWSEESDYFQAQNYASIFDGKVYRVR